MPDPYLIDESEGYRATDGTFVAVPPTPALPDGEVDLDRFRGAARKSAAKAAERSFSQLFDALEQSYHTPDAMPLKLAISALSSRIFRRIEDILFEARAHRLAHAGQHADALIDCLGSPDTAGDFQSLLPRVLGFPPLTYANGYASWMERENPWVMRLLEGLPPAWLVPALSGGLGGHLFDHFRPIFHEPGLLGFLESPVGDLRHLEGSAALNHNRVDLGIDIKGIMTGGTSEALKATLVLRRRAAKMKKDRPPSEPEVSEALGVKLAEGELDRLGPMGSLIERAARETKPQAVQPARGTFLAYHLRFGSRTSGLMRVPQHALWPYLATRLDILDKAFGLDGEAKVDHGYQPQFATEILRRLPKTPERYKDVLYRLAVGKKRLGRLNAQRLLKGAEGLLPRLEKSLNARGKEERLQAARCLGQTGNRAAIKPIQARLSREKNAEVQNACLASLGSLGVKIRAFGPDRAALVQEAKTGLGKPLPETRAFLADLYLPDLKFHDGTPAPLELGPWLLRYGADMGMPARNALLNLRTAHLDRASRIALARAVLDGWVRHDTLRWTDISFETHRALFAREMYKIYLDIHGLEANWYRHRYVPGAPPKSPADHAKDISEAEIKEFLRCRKNWGLYVNSAYDAKGALALVGALPVGEVRDTLLRYLKDHTARGPQIKALMSLLASYAGKAPVRELCLIADSQKQKSIKQHAIDLLDDLGHGYAPPAADRGEASDFNARPDRLSQP
ncbi:MAG: hypothetical protein AAF667_09715 [Pseudomonadota bacterium]